MLIMEKKHGGEMRKKNAEKDLKHRIGLHYFKIMKKCKKKKKNPHNLQIVKLTFPFS